MELKTCPICMSDYHPMRDHCQVCGAYHVIDNIYYDGNIQIVAAYGCQREPQPIRARLFSSLELCDAQG
jgi:hypothetical protein